MKNKHFIRAVAVLFGVLLCMVSGCNNNAAVSYPAFSNSGDYDCDIDIEPVVFVKYGKHIYYREDRFFKNENYEGENDAIKKCFETKDSGESANIYVYDYIADGRDRKVTGIQLYGYEYVDGIIIADKPYYAQSESDIPHFTKMFGARRQHTPSRLLTVDPQKIFPKVAELACKNRTSMLMDKGNTIYGTYLLKYVDGNDYLYYEFTLNRYSCIRVNARTGEIDYSKFSAGYVFGD